jgi:hypothetical protein
LNYVKKYDATGHGKGVSDGEGSNEKGSVDRANMDVKKGDEDAQPVRTALQACEHMAKVLNKPTKDITAKEGVGVQQRAHVFIPGPGEQPHTTTYGGHDFVVPSIKSNQPGGVQVKKQHEVRCVGVPGEIDLRDAACPCTAGGSSGEVVCTCDGVSSGRVPMWRRIHIEQPAVYDLPTTRNGMKQRGKRLCDKLGEGGGGRAGPPPPTLLAGSGDGRWRRVVSSRGGI